MNKKNSMKNAIKAILEYEFYREYGNKYGEKISFSDMIMIVDKLYKNHMLSYRMQMLYIAYNNGYYELKRYYNRNKDKLANYTKRIENENDNDVYFYYSNKWMKVFEQNLMISTIMRAVKTIKIIKK